MDREAEIDQIKKELEILRARYALYGRMGRILKIFLMVWIPLFAIGILALATKLFLFDTFYGVFFVGVALIIFVAGIIWLVGYPDPRDKHRPLRWMDFASPPLQYSNTFTDLSSFLLRRPVSDVEMIEQQIADRERRLSELGEKP